MTSDPSPLSSLLGYFEPLSTSRRDFRGTATLHTPGSPILGANATYLLPGLDLDMLPMVRAWHLSQEAPPLVVGVGPIPDAEEVAAVRVGTYRPQPEPGVVVVEQVSRLQVARFAAVLAEAHGLLEWAGPLAGQLARRLEPRPEAVLLLAYAGGEAVGALLMLGGAAHLWGTLDPAIDAPLLNMAAELSGGRVVTSLTDASPLDVEGGQVLRYALLD